MSASLTEKEFTKHVGTNFQVQLEPQPADLKLAEVKAYLPGENEQPGMERFSIFFDGPREPFLPQRLYTVSHEKMGEFEIFIVPIVGNEKGFRYEAVFNYHI